MTQPDTLHTRLRDEINRRLAIAQNALNGGWESLTRWLPPLADYLRLHDPADAIRRYEGELEVLERHAEGRFDGPSAAMFGDGPWCRACRGNDWPCLDLILLAGRLGVSVDG